VQVLLLVLLVLVAVYLAVQWCLQDALLLPVLVVVHHEQVPPLLLQEAAAVAHLHNQLLKLMLLCFQFAACSTQQDPCPWRSCQLHPWEARRTQSCVSSSH
jgi:hypothetical protein